MRIGPNPNWMIGERFGRWVVVAFHGRHRGTKYLHVVCDCGRQNVIQQKCLTRGESESCGCLAREIAAKQQTKHGHARRDPHGRRWASSEYKTWDAMLRRCRDVERPEWQDYGGRGITVCERWQTFINFYADMGPKPPGLSIERIDNNGNYEPNNCKWATSLEQMRNRRCSIYLEVGGIRLPLMEWSKRTGIRYGVLISRVRHGWTPQRTITERPPPYRPRKKR